MRENISLQPMNNLVLRRFVFIFEIIHYKCDYTEIVGGGRIFVKFLKFLIKLKLKLLLGIIFFFASSNKSRSSRI